MTDDTNVDESTTDGGAEGSREELEQSGSDQQTDLPDGGTATADPDGGPATADSDGGTATGDQDGDTDPTASTGATGQTDAVLGGRFRRWVNYLVLAALAILALVAGIRFYAAVGTMIERFVVREFRPVFHATFNLALLFLAGAGVTLQLRRMR